MELLMLLAMPLMLLGGFALDAATSDGDAPDNAPDNSDAEDTDQEPIL